MIRIAAWVAVGLVLSSPAGAALETLEEVDACLKANLPSPSSVQTVVLDAHDRIGTVTRTRVRIYWRRFDDGLSRVLVQLSDPPEMRGAALLMIEKKSDRNDIMMYLPALDRVKRVTGHMLSGSMFGTDFSYEEFERLQGLSGESFDRVLGANDPVEGRPAYVVDSTLKPGFDEMSAYKRLRTWIDQETCVPLKVEFYEAGDRLRKRLSTDVASIEVIGSRNVARRIEISDTRDDTHTVLRVEDIDFEAKVNRSLFTTGSLERKGGESF